MTSKLEFDCAKPYDHRSTDEFYAKYKPASPSPSSKTCSSTNSLHSYKNNEIIYGCGSSTASDSDIELDPVPIKEQFLKYHNDPNSCSNVFSNDGNLVVVNPADKNAAEASIPRIGTVAVQNSTDIQFGNKTFFNGPVTIKQFMLDEKNNKWIRTSDENGIANKGFDGETYQRCSERRWLCTSVWRNCANKFIVQLLFKQWKLYFV